MLRWAQIAVQPAALCRTGNSSQSRPSSVRPAGFLLTPPHCLKKKHTPASRHWSRISVTQSSSIGREPGPDSPPTIAQSIPVRSRFVAVPAAAPGTGTSPPHLFVSDHQSGRCSRPARHLPPSRHSAARRSKETARPGDRLCQNLEVVPVRSPHHIKNPGDEIERDIALEHI